MHELGSVQNVTEWAKVSEVSESGLKLLPF
jgi:hypothetical protein